MHSSFTRHLAGLAIALAAVNVAAAPTFNTFVSGGDLSAALADQDAIGFTFAGNKFVGSTYYNNQLYKTALDGTAVSKFGAPLPIASNDAGEIYVSSSLGLGGFASRGIFAGSQNFGTVWTYANNASEIDAATALVTGLNGGVRSIAFDPYGSYGNNMIVATMTGHIYKVDSSGNATELANVGVDTEGLDFAPQAFGPNVPAGTLMVLSEGDGHVRAIKPNGDVFDLGLIFLTPEMLSFVPLDFNQTLNPLAGFYAARYPSEVAKAAYSDFSAYAGQAIVTEEGTHDIYAIAYADGTGYTKTYVGNFGGQPEDGIFVTAAILDPGCNQRPGGCGGTLPEPSSLLLVAAGLIGCAGLRRSRRRDPA
jgi:PEP-CTERM motif